MLRRLKEELILIIPAIIYFAIFFNFIHFAAGLQMQPGDIRYYNYWQVTLAALVVGKVIIILNALPFFNAFPHKPLIYNITWKFFLACIGTLLFRFFDIYLHLFFLYENSLMAKSHLMAEIIKPIFWSTQLWVWVGFLIYIIFDEITRVVGRRRMLHLIFGY